MGRAFQSSVCFRGPKATSARTSGLSGSGAEGIIVMVVTLATIIKSANTGQAPAVGTAFWLHLNRFNVRYLTGSTMVSILLLYLFIVCSWGLVMTQFAQPHAIANSKIHVQDTVTKHGCPPLCLCRPWRGTGCFHLVVSGNHHTDGEGVEAFRTF